MQQTRVGMNRQRLGFAVVALHVDGAGVDRGAVRFHSAVEQLAQVHRLRAQLDLPSETEHIVDDAVEPVHGGGDLARVVVRFAHVRLIPGQIVLDHAGVELDRAERVADLVRDAGGHLAQRRQPLGPLELRVGRRQLTTEAQHLVHELFVRVLQPLGDLVVGADDLGQVIAALTGLRGVRCCGGFRGFRGLRRVLDVDVHVWC